MRHIENWQKVIHTTNTAKGFYDYKKDLEMVKGMILELGGNTPGRENDDGVAALKRLLVDYERCLIERKLLLAIGELVEAQNELRTGHSPTEVYYHEGDPKPEGFGIELADAVIRTLDIAADSQLDMEYLMNEKHDFNVTRSYKHGRQF